MSPTCEPRPAAVSVRPGVTKQQAWCTLRPDSFYLREFRKIYKGNSRQAIHMEKPLETAWVGLKVGGAEPQGISRVGQTV